LLANRAYANKATLEASGLSMPPDLDGRYTWDVDVDATPSYTIVFTAIGPQAGDGPLELDSQGVKTPADKW
jgi:type IV pilus assembly protein PilE